MVFFCTLARPALMLAPSILTPRWSSRPTIELRPARAGRTSPTSTERFTYYLFIYFIYLSFENTLFTELRLRQRKGFLFLFLFLLFSFFLSPLLSDFPFFFLEI